MWIYRLKDFFQSRLGQTCIFVLVTIGLLIFLAGYFKKRQAAQEQIASALPSLPQEALWQAPDEPQPGQTTDEEFTVSAPNKDFTPFRPLPPKAAPTIPAPSPVAAAESPSLVGAVFPLPPMVIFERETKSTTSHEPILLPDTDDGPPKLDLEDGSLLYCELITPVSSDQSDAPVLARLTRPLIQHGQLLLPASTTLSGSLQQATNNRMFLAEKWRVRLPSGEWTSITAHAQEAAYNPSTKQYAATDGQTGLPVLTAPEIQQKDTLWKDAFGKLVVAAGKAGQDRTRTAIGEYIPGSARNSVLGATTGVIEHYTERPEEAEAKSQVIHRVEAGQRFYLYVLKGS